MRNIILVTRSDKFNEKWFVNLDHIIAVSLPIGKVFDIKVDNETWTLPAESYENLMSLWASYYKNLASYNEYVTTTDL